MHLLLHTLLHSLEHRAATGKHDITEEILPDISIALDDSVVGELVDSILVVLNLLLPVVW